MPQPAITVIGLGLDILGAGLIAIPDVRTLFSQFSAGALKEARVRMALVGVREGDTGFDPLRKLLNEIDPVAEFGTNNNGGEYVEIQINSLSGVQTTETHEATLSSLHGSLAHPLWKRFPTDPSEDVSPHPVHRLISKRGPQPSLL